MLQFRKKKKIRMQRKNSIHHFDTEFAHPWRKRMQVLKFILLFNYHVIFSFFSLFRIHIRTRNENNYIVSIELFLLRTKYYEIENELVYL